MTWKEINAHYLSKNTQHEITQNSWEGRERISALKSKHYSLKLYWGQDSSKQEQVARSVQFVLLEAARERRKRCDNDRLLNMAEPNAAGMTEALLEQSKEKGLTFGGLRGQDDHNRTNMKGEHSGFTKEFQTLPRERFVFPCKTALQSSTQWYCDLLPWSCGIFWRGLKCLYTFLCKLAPRLGHSEPICEQSVSKTSNRHKTEELKWCELCISVASFRSLSCFSFNCERFEALGATSKTVPNCWIPETCNAEFLCKVESITWCTFWSQYCR